MVDKLKVVVIIITVFLLGTSFVYQLSVDENMFVNEAAECTDEEYRKMVYIEKFNIYEDSVKNEIAEVDYVSGISNLSEHEVDFLFDRAEEIAINPYIILGLIEMESRFNRYAVGSKGERGLGQLMANTAKPVAENLGIEYDPEKLFEPEYNILIFTTQLKYLYNYYDGDIHKTLTAYNRGQYGLEKYIASRSNHANPAVSDYSLRVMEKANKIRLEFDKN